MKKLGQLRNVHNFVVGNQIQLPFFFSFFFFLQLILSCPFLSSLRCDLGNGTFLIGLNCFLLFVLVIEEVRAIA